MSFIQMGNAWRRSGERQQQEQDREAERAEREIQRQALMQGLEHQTWQRGQQVENVNRQRAQEVLAQRQAEERRRNRSAVLTARGVPQEQHAAIVDDDDVFSAYAKPQEPKWSVQEGDGGFYRVDPNTNRAEIIPGIQPKPPAPRERQPNVVATQRLGERYDRDQTIKDASTVAASVGALRSAATVASPAADLAFIFGFMKLLDPNSTVREGEFAQIESSRSAPGWLKQMARRARTGERLSVAEKARYVETANAIVESRRRSVAPIQKRYGALAAQSGADSALVAHDPFEGLDAPNAPASPVTPAVSPQALWDAAVAKHGRAKVLREFGPRPK